MSLKSNRLEVGFSIYDPEDKIRQKDTRNKSVIWDLCHIKYVFDNPMKVSI